jgi:hypothetical protein
MHLMRRTAVFWPIVLIVVGVILLLQNLGLFTFNIWAIIWPLLLVALGLWIVVNSTSSRNMPLAVQAVSVPLEGAKQARVRVRHGAGKLTVSNGARPEELLDGSFAGGVSQRVRRSGDLLDLVLEVPEQGFSRYAFPWGVGPGRTLDWAFGLNKDVALMLNFETGASDTRLDLSGLRVTDLVLQTGASSTEVTLPAAAGQTRVKIEAGVASVVVRVPSTVAARIRASGALAGIDMDTRRFPRSGDVYESPDYASAVNRVEITANAGVGSVAVR